MNHVSCASLATSKATDSLFPDRQLRILVQFGKAQRGAQVE